MVVVEFSGRVDYCKDSHTACNLVCNVCMFLRGVRVAVHAAGGADRDARGDRLVSARVE